jgi:hypothetical protein
MVVGGAVDDARTGPDRVGKLLVIVPARLKLAIGITQLRF